MVKFSEGGDLTFKFTNTPREPKTTLNFYDGYESWNSTDKPMLEKFGIRSSIYTRIDLKNNTSHRIPPGYSVHFHKSWQWGKTLLFHGGSGPWRKSFGFLSIEWFPKS